HLPRIFSRESLALFMVAAQLEGAIHQPLHVHVFMDYLSDSDRLALLYEIPTPKFVRRKSDSFRDAIEMPLEREDALRGSESAERAVRRSIRCDGSAANAHVGTAVRPGGVNRPARKHHRRQCFIRSAVQREVDIDRHQLSVPGYGGAMCGPRR